MRLSARQTRNTPRPPNAMAAPRDARKAEHDAIVCGARSGADHKIRRGTARLLGHDTRHGPPPKASCSRLRAGRGVADASSEDGFSVDAFPVDEALNELDRCQDRDSVLRVVLRAADLWLDDVQIYFIRGGFLFGQVAMTPGGLEERPIRSRGMAVNASAAVRHVLEKERGVVIPIDDSDPLGDHTYHRRLVAQPILVGKRPVCLVVGGPGSPDPKSTLQLLVSLKRLADAAAVVLLRLVLVGRQEGQSTPDDSPAAAAPDRDEAPAGARAPRDPDWWLEQVHLCNSAC